MKNYFYRLNEKYLKNFSKNVLSKFNDVEIKTDIMFLKTILREVNELFKKLGGRAVSKSDIPKEDEYPDSKKFNALLSDIEHDVDKLYTAQGIIDDDVTNLMNFNATQRQKSYENFSNIQQKVLSVYVRNKKEVTGEFIIENNF